MEAMPATDERKDDLLDKMSEAKKRWDAEDDANPDGPDDTDRLLSQAIELAIEQGKGWAPGEREEYLKKITEDDYLPPLFATNEDELEESGLKEAFSSLMYDEGPTRAMLDFKKKGNDSFMDGKRNVAGNVQYYRDAINHYYQAFTAAQSISPVKPGYTPPPGQTESDDPVYTKEELDEMKSTLCANAAMAHMQLKNWGYVRDDSLKALEYNKNNVKAWYRLAKAHQMLKNWEEAGDVIGLGLAIEGESENKDLKKLQKLLADKVRKARIDRQKRERARAERVARVKEVWKWCKDSRIQLGRVPLVATVTDDEEDLTDGGEEFRWHNHHPHTGRLPQRSAAHEGGWVWPCMFLYPSHSHSDFVEHFGESEMIALRMADMFPELEDEGDETLIPWDYNNEFTCGNLAVYFEVHCTENKGDVIHPECVEQLKNQGECMRFYESSRALKGDEGPEMTNVARCVERKHLHQQRKAWKKKHGSLWAKPKPCPVVRVHPAMTLRDVLVDDRMVVPSFLVTFLLFPIKHPAHKAFLKEHECIGIIQPEATE